MVKSLEFLAKEHYISCMKKFKLNVRHILHYLMIVFAKTTPIWIEKKPPLYPSHKLVSVVLHG